MARRVCSASTAGQRGDVHRELLRLQGGQPPRQGRDLGDHTDAEPLADLGRAVAPGTDRARDDHRDDRAEQCNERGECEHEQPVRRVRRRWRLGDVDDIEDGQLLGGVGDEDVGQRAAHGATAARTVLVTLMSMMPVPGSPVAATETGASWIVGGSLAARLEQVRPRFELREVLGDEEIDLLDVADLAGDDRGVDGDRRR